MAQDAGKTLPEFINTDQAFEHLQPDECGYAKNYETSINGNPDIGIGSDNGTGEGQNQKVLTPIRSNVVIPTETLPSGFNKNIGTFESTTTQELYYFNYNSNLQHGIYVLNGNTNVWQQVIVDPTLKFSDIQEAYIAEHRVHLRIKRDANGNIIEKYLLITEGTTFHKWIDVIASIETNGFTLPADYWALQPPHFDREELLAWAFRSPMIAPIARLLPNLPDYNWTPNKILGYAFQFCTQDVYTDGRTTLTSPFSVPTIIKQSDYLSNPDLIPKSIELTITAGSAKCEYKNIYVRQTLRKSTSDLGASYGDWYLYDTIYKYTDSGSNSFNVIGNKYWLRTGKWSNYNYDSVFNTIKYVFDNTKLGQIVDQTIFPVLGNDMPQLSVASSDLGDAVQLANNRNGFYNFSKEITDKLSTEIIQDKDNSCPVVLREIKLYVYAGRERGTYRVVHDGDFAQDVAGGYIRDIWHSQVGYFVGTDTEMRFGGQYFGALPSFGETGIMLEDSESKQFNLDFAGKNGFRCYLKGTEYYSDCEWYVSSQDFQLQKIDGLIDKNSTSDISFLTNTVKNFGFFVGVFTFNVPADRYTACLGRHNVAGDGNYRDASTYVMGIANSRLASIVTYSSVLIGNLKVNTVKPDAFVSNSKEIEVDCTNGDVDVWGRGAQGDLFYVFTPFDGYANAGGFFTADNNNWKFIEGYLNESETDQIAMERFAYDMYYAPSPYAGVQHNGTYTDKNGFFFANSWARDDRNLKLDIRFQNTVDCSTGFTFTVEVQDGVGWFKDIIAFFAAYHSNAVGFGNYIRLGGKITDITGTIPYSNIAISIVDGATAYTDSNGEFSMHVHNGLSTLRNSNVYVNAGGNFNIFLAGCGQIPLFNFSQANYPCQTVTERFVANFINLNVIIVGSEFTSLKQNASYIATVVGADLAGRVTFCNKFSLPNVPSFLQRLPSGNVYPTYLNWILTGNLGLDKDTRTADIKWLAFYISKPINYKKYLQWVADKIEFVDSNGNVTTDTASASLVKITISSLLETNIANNLSLLANYQFQQDDRLRVYDNGDGVLLDNATYGDTIDVQIQGTNYNQAAVNANLIPPAENTVLTANNTTGTDPITLYVKYDQRFDVLKNKTDCWIELYTPSQNTEKLPFFQVESFYPIINGEIAIYTGGGVSNPTYTYPKKAKLNYWDTYLIRRNIIGIGKFISHPFESPNITDTWGANITSGGKQNEINTNAAQVWYVDSTIKSDDYTGENLINGLAMFRRDNIKNFKGYGRGGIIAISCQYSIVLFICENDYFVVDYNYNYIFANAQGVQIANLSDRMGEPHQKVGENYGCRLQDTSTIIFVDEFVWWMDIKNQGAILCDYKNAIDVSDIIDKEGNKFGIKSYLIEKIKTIQDWNYGKDVSKKFDIICGIDMVRKNIYTTFRPRRNNTVNTLSFVNNRRTWDLKHQETLVYNLDTKRWKPLAGFTPESYGKLRGNLGTQFISFASGIPYRHNNQNTSYVTFYGQKTEPVLSSVYNKDEDLVKIMQSLSLDINNSILFADLIYSTQVYGYSYIPLSWFKEKEKMFYAPFLKDMVTYLQDPVDGDFRSTLIDGKRVFGEYFIVRFVQEYAKLGQYFELNGIQFLTTNSAPTKP